MILWLKNDLKSAIFLKYYIYFIYLKYEEENFYNYYIRNFNIIDKTSKIHLWNQIKEKEKRKKKHKEKDQSLTF